MDLTQAVFLQNDLYVNVVVMWILNVVVTFTKSTGWNSFQRMDDRCGILLGVETKHPYAFQGWFGPKVQIEVVKPKLKLEEFHEDLAIGPRPEV